MSDEYANPFRVWAELLRDLRARFQTQVFTHGASPPSPYTAEALGSMAGIISQCDALAKRIDSLERHDPAAYAAFQRAVGVK